MISKWQQLRAAVVCAALFSAKITEKEVIEMSERLGASGEKIRSTEIKTYEKGETVPDGKTCALFVTGSSSNPELQFDLVFQDLNRDVPGMAIKYADFGQDSFDPDEISGKILMK